MICYVHLLCWYITNERSDSLIWQTLYFTIAYHVTTFVESSLSKLEWNLLDQCQICHWHLLLFQLTVKEQ